MLDNAIFHHKALRSLAETWAYYPPATPAQALVFGNQVPVKQLDSANNNGTSARAQAYVLRNESSHGSDDGRYV